MSESASTDHERLQLRTAARQHRCWTWSEMPGSGEPQCTRLIGKGETYGLSTIYPGHDSGYADTYSKRIDGAWVDFPGRPLTHRFCLPCCERWTNLRDLLNKIGADA